MKIQTTIAYDRPYIPQGYRKVRYEEFYHEVVTGSIREVSGSDVKLAMIAYGYHLYGIPRDIKIFSYRGKLYREAEVYPQRMEEYGFKNALEELVYSHEHCSTYYSKTKNFLLSTKAYLHPSNRESRDEIIKRLRKDLRSLLIIDGVLYCQVPAPMYRLVTFGWGGCGTSLGLTGYRYTRNAPVAMRGLYWSALDYEAAIAKANEVAAKRGDTQDVGKFRKLVNVFMPEMVKRVYL